MKVHGVFQHVAGIHRVGDGAVAAGRKGHAFLNGEGVLLNDVIGLDAAHDAVQVETGQRTGVIAHGVAFPGPGNTSVVVFRFEIVFLSAVGIDDQGSGFLPVGDESVVSDGDGGAGVGILTGDAVDGDPQGVIGRGHAGELVGIDGRLGVDGEISRTAGAAPEADLEIAQIGDIVGKEIFDHDIADGFPCGDVDLQGIGNGEIGTGGNLPGVGAVALENRSGFQQGNHVGINGGGVLSAKERRIHGGSHRAGIVESVLAEGEAADGNDLVLPIGQHPIGGVEAGGDLNRGGEIVFGKRAEGKFDGIDILTDEIGIGDDIVKNRRSSRTGAAEVIRTGGTDARGEHRVIGGEARKDVHDLAVGGNLADRIDRGAARILGRRAVDAYVLDLEFRRGHEVHVWGITGGVTGVVELDLEGDVIVDKLVFRDRQAIGNRDIHLGNGVEKDPRLKSLEAQVGKAVCFGG